MVSLQDDLHQLILANEIVDPIISETVTAVSMSWNLEFPKIANLIFILFILFIYFNFIYLFLFYLFILFIYFNFIYLFLFFPHCSKIFR